ncbi:hypothetical protein [Gordonia polyisoprenivorans]|uniref:hypothetical protein n=1 Tax=Gordonia polyisoprenivorans TaxID=84595 RepID=UPI0023008609|nr:hypothetical protein [Gordonia polyisoprenivorans]WCB37962.1 hypothetical protein PHA63_02015 [Gordonia polyisoprenivorans]
MDSEGCWSTVVSTAAERRALGLPESAGWMLECRLPIGHRGNHATDGSTSPRNDRRFWLEWNDFDPHAQSLIERNPCPVRSLENAPCLYFHGHPGPHLYVRSNGHAPTAMSGMAAGGHSHAGLHSSAPGPEYSTQGTAPGPSGSHGPSTGDLPVAGAGARGSHRMPEPPRPEPSRPEPSRPEPFRPEPSRSEPPMVGESDYRGGRRSTDSAPPHDQTPYHGRRHSFDVPASRPEPTFAPDEPYVATAPTPAPSEFAAQQSAPAHDLQPTLGLTEVGDALDDVATALSRLAAALRRD